MSGASGRDLAGRIRAARRVQPDGMSQERLGREVARLTGRRRPFSDVTVSNWEAGRQEPNWEALVAIARLTGLPLEYFGGVGTVEDYPVKQGADHVAGRLAPELRILLGASQRLDPEQQQIVARRVEALLEALGE